MTNRGNWFLTYTGIQFFPFDPRPEEICIEDIAHALANICRFGGHTKTFYSVAQHSMHVAALCEYEDLVFQALMHDATEAYVGDMIRPLKEQQPLFKMIESRIWDAIAEKFNIPVELHPEVKRCDDVALMTERRDLLHHTDHKWSVTAKPDPDKIVPLSPYDAEIQFLQAFYARVP